MEILHANVLGSGEDLIILHGFLGMSDNWKTLGSKFAQEGFRVHLIDQRNHGRSFHSEEFSYELMVQDLINYMEVNHIEQAALLGHSMGGKTAMFAACLHPRRFTKILVADIAPKAYPPHHQEIINALLELEKIHISSRGQADELMSKYLSDWGIRQFLLKNLYRKTPDRLRFRFHIEVLSKQMDTIGKALAPSDYYSGPVLFIRGGKSDYVLDTDEVEIQKHFSNYQIKTIPDTGHWLHAEAPEVFFEMAVSFFK